MTKRRPLYKCQRCKSEYAKPYIEEHADGWFCRTCLTFVGRPLAELVTLYVCEGCRKGFVSLDQLTLISREEIANNADLSMARSGWFCKDCLETAYIAYKRTCEVCGAVFRAEKANSKQSRCDACFAVDVQQEERRVRQCLNESRAAGLAATLTLDQWLATIEHFGKLCAYCQKRPFSTLDHFIPTVRGGGTTARHSVPACLHCNSAKGMENMATKAGRKRFGCDLQTIAAIEDYLATLKA